MTDYIAAIDLGTTKIVGLIGKKTEFGKYQIVANYDIPSEGIQRGEVQNIKDVSALLETVIDEMKSQSQIDFSEVYVGIAGQHIKCSCQSGDLMRMNANDEIVQDELDTLRKKMYSLKFEPGESILHIIPQSFNIDEKMDVQNPVGMLGSRIEGNFHIVIGKTQATEIIERCIGNQKNIALKKLILEPLASSAAVLTDEEKEAGVAMVDIGGGTTDLMIFYDGIVRHSAVIPFGGNVITEDIKQGCGVLQRQAESMKIQFGSCLGDLCQDNKIITIPGINGREPREISFKSLSKIIDARMGEILDAVMYEINLSGFTNKLNMGIVFTGGGSQLTNLSQFAKYKTGLDARVGRPTCITIDSDNRLSNPIYSTSIGLIIEGFRNEEQNASNNMQQTYFEKHTSAPVIDWLGGQNQTVKPIEELVEKEEVLETAEKKELAQKTPRHRSNGGSIITKIFKPLTQISIFDDENTDNKNKV